MIVNNRLNEIKDGKYGKIKIIRYGKYEDIDIEFENGYIAKNKSYKDFKKYSLFNPYFPSIYNRGYLGSGNYVAKINDKHTKEYLVWRTMFVRCYNEEYNKKHPTYQNCEVCKEWYDFQVFAEWFSQNYYTVNNEIMDLDKDFLSNGNRIYSPESCIFLPQFINKAIVHSNMNFSKSSTSNNKYHARISKRSKQIHLGYYDNLEDAIRVYIKAKEEYLKELAYEYKALLPKRVFDVLENYRIGVPTILN